MYREAGIGDQVGRPYTAASRYVNKVKIADAAEKNPTEYTFFVQRDRHQGPAARPYTTAALSNVSKVKTAVATKKMSNIHTFPVPRG